MTKLLKADDCGLKFSTDTTIFSLFFILCELRIYQDVTNSHCTSRESWSPKKREEHLHVAHDMRHLLATCHYTQVSPACAVISYSDHPPSDTLHYWACSASTWASATQQPWMTNAQMTCHGKQQWPLYLSQFGNETNWANWDFPTNSKRYECFSWLSCAGRDREECNATLHYSQFVCIDVISYFVIGI